MQALDGIPRYIVHLCFGVHRVMSHYSIVHFIMLYHIRLHQMALYFREYSEEIDAH